MKIRRFAPTEPAIRKRNLGARTVGVYRNCGCAISITIAAMILTSRRISADRRIVLPDGNVVLGELIIGEC